MTLSKAASGHTPGPWSVANQTDVFTGLGATCADGRVADANDGWQIADCMTGITSVQEEIATLSVAEARANARLIAAAPDMLEALREAETALRSCYQVADYPANGRTDQDDALRTVRAAIETAEGRSNG
jgi:hypothetical protein